MLDDWAYDAVYGADLVEEIGRRVELVPESLDSRRLAMTPEALRDVEIIFGGWGMPPFDADLLRRLPRLKAVLVGAGSIKSIVSEAFWSRDIVITSGYGMNAIPVAEYTLATILFSLKLGWRYAWGMKVSGEYLPRLGPIPGAFGTTIGLVSLGAIGLKVVEYLRPFSLKVIAYDPYFNPSVAQSLGVELVSLEDVFQRSQVVSLHTPSLPETQGMITGRLFEMMRADATFINTARGVVVREEEMIAVLQKRPDLTAVLDVLHPEPPRMDSPILTLPNVVLTPHIAGSVDGECRRIGQCMLDELDRLLAGQPLQWRATREQIVRMA